MDHRHASTKPSLAERLPFVERALAEFEQPEPMAQECRILPIDRTYLESTIHDIVRPALNRIGDGFGEAVRRMSDQQVSSLVWNDADEHVRLERHASGATALFFHNGASDQGGFLLAATNRHGQPTIRCWHDRRDGIGGGHDNADDDFCDPYGHRQTFRSTGDIPMQRQELVMDRDVGVWDVPLSRSFTYDMFTRQEGTISMLESLITILRDHPSAQSDVQRRA